jgi:transcriptional regulator with XRE-family HTH domain
MLERINLILKSRNLNAAQFADEIGVQRSSVSHILTGRNNASLDFLLKVLTRYPEIDTDWLLTGKGVMVRSSSSCSKNISEAKMNETTHATSIPSIMDIPVDLFRQPTVIREEIKGKDIDKDEKITEIDNQNQLFIKKEEQQKMPDEIVNKTISARQIDRIVIFYSDKTFTDYKPEN